MGFCKVNIIPIERFSGAAFVFVQVPSYGKLVTHSFYKYERTKSCQIIVAAMFAVLWAIT